MNKILITGATGFIGKYLVKYLLQKNLKIRVLVQDNKKISSLPEGVEIFVGNLTLPQSLVGICEGIDAVFHLAGFAHAWAETNTSFAEQHHAVNFQGTKNILDEAIRAHVKKFIFFSSVKAVADSDKCIDETWVVEPTSHYGIAKRQAEKLVLAAKDNMHVCVLRPSLVYGPGWKGNLANMLHAVNRSVFPPLPKINNRRSMIGVEDMCQAAFLAANIPQANGQIYFVTDGVDYSTDQLYASMRVALGKDVPKWHVPLWIFKILASIGDVFKKTTRRRFPLDSDALSKLFGSAQYSSARIQRDLQFKPQFDLNKMLPEIVAEHLKSRM